MTPAEMVRSTTSAQGLPEHVEDPSTLARLAADLLDSREVAHDAAA